MPENLSPPTVSICIPTYNQSQYLEECVRSACSQSYAGHIEVWVSDDASTDDTPKVIEKLKSEFPQLNYYRQPVNGGIAVNNSWLMRRPQTKYLVRLDSDDFLAPEFIEKLVDAMEKNPQAGYGHTAIQFINKESQPTWINRLARASGYQEADTALRASLSGYRTAANILMFPTAALAEMLYYDSRPEFVEDYDLSVRIADAGYGNVYLDDVLAYYRVWNDDANKRGKRIKLQLSGYIRIFDESLQPAFARRGWDLRAVERQRQRLAANYVAACSQRIFSPAERAELEKLLLQLSDSPQVRLRLALCRRGFAPLLGAVASLQLSIRRTAKKALKIVRKG